MELNARELVNFTLAELLALPEESVTIHYDDGTLESETEHVVFSWFVYEFHRQYPKTPLLKHVHFMDRAVQKRSHIKMIERIMFDCYEAYNRQLDMDKLKELAYRITNNIYNWIANDLGEYVNTISGRDILEIARHPTMIKIRQDCDPTYGGVSRANQELKALLMDHNELKLNPIAVGIRSNLLRFGQVNYCIGRLGFRTEINGRVFRVPIMRCFSQGLRTIYDSLIEGRSATRSIIYSKDLLSNAEYARRKLQLVCGVARRVHKVDCGSTKYMEFHVQTKDLQGIAGKWYRTSEGLKEVKESDQHLVGKIIQLRMTHYCLHPDPYGMCEVCYGTIADNISRGINVGFVSGLNTSNVQSQTIMSIKHEDTAAIITNITLTDYERKYFRNDLGDSYIHLNKRLKGHKITLRLQAKECKGILDIRNVENVKTLQTTALSSISDVRLILVKNNSQDIADLCVAMGTRQCSLTHEALAFMKAHDWGYSDNGDYELDLTKWDFEQPLFELPLKDMGVAEYVESVKAKILGAKKDKNMSLRSVCYFDDYDQALMSLYMLARSRMSIHLNHLEIIMWSLSVRSRMTDDYRVPLAGETHQVGKFAEIMEKRSLAALLTYQGHERVILNPGTYLNDLRADHYLDEIVVPKSVM